MAARTGKNFWPVCKLRVKSGSTARRLGTSGSHPAFAGAARTLAEIFDLQHEARDVCLMRDPETESRSTSAT